MRWVKTYVATVGGSIALAVIGGGLSALQIRINGELGQATNSALVAALAAIGVGMVVAWIVVMVRRIPLRIFARLNVGWRQWWLLTGGLCGAFYVTTFVMASPIVGIAVTAVAILAGQVLGGLLLDRLPAFANTPVTAARLAGAILAVATVAFTQLGAGQGSWQPALLLLVCVAGVALGTQAAVHGKLRQRVESLPLVLALNFTLASVVLLIIVLAQQVLGNGGGWHLPSEWWLYSGGVLGLTCVGIFAFVAPIIGVLRLVMAVAAGQLLGALVLDLALPIGPGFRPQLIGAAVLTLVALWIASPRPKKAPAVAKADL